MLLYRVFPYLPTAAAGQPGHPTHVHTPQGKGRLDNPNEYLCWYLSADATGAVAEVFADILTWHEGMFATPFLPGAQRVLGTYRISDDTPILDLDDAKHLLERGLRPTQVIERSRPATRAWALAIFNERTAAGDRAWKGVRWWSYHRPQWRIFGLWQVTPVCTDVAELDLSHPAVRDAAAALAKPLPVG